MEELRRAHLVRNNRSSRHREKTQDLCEQGMRVPAFVLNSCNESFTAADEKCQKVSLIFLCYASLQIYI